ncbi:universal stress protein [Saccharothrix mutabilis subsp. mutabilis]|uniref:Universal stress protein n=1 Tax=Saccharothrix mutabilis subsp. mutabilis TaxID=66855 RepID=A0ABP3ED23_9PSEU
MIVVGVDGSREAQAAVRWAVAEGERRGLPVRLVHAYRVPPIGFPVSLLPAEEVRGEYEEQGRRILAETGHAGETRLVEAGTVDALVAESRQADLVVLGARGTGGFEGLRAGSVATAVAAHGSCPVVVVRGHERTTGPVVVGVDGAPAGEAAIGFAFEAASARGAALRAVHVPSPLVVAGPDAAPRLAFDRDVLEREGERLLAQRLAGWQERYPDVTVERRVVHESPARALIDHAEDAQLLVVGSHGHGGFVGMLLGSIGQAMVLHAPCPVAVVRPAEG